jgi:hypothetical protein
MIWKRKKPLKNKGFPAPFDGLEEPTQSDFRGIPTMECPCGCDWLVMVFRYDPETRLPGLLLLDGLCAACGALLTLATPVDEGVGNDL